MKKIISGMLICTVLLNSFSVIASGEELVKTETTGETGLVTQATSETATNSTEDTSSVTEENTSERDSSTSSTKEESLDSSTNSTTEEHSSVSETNTTDSKTEASQSSEVEKKTIDQDEADYQEAAREGTNHKKGTYAMKNGLSSRVARATVANVYANDPNLPGKNFIDVSSWNGDISVAEYQKIKSYGVTGVSVKLTEGTWYVNPYAAGQIRNAKAAGLKVSAYHYSMYVSAATAQDEARYFAQAAANSGLDKNTIMFNDAEDPTLTNNGRNAHANSVAFNQQLKALGYKNDALYVGKWWLTNGYIDTSAFGRDRVWVAQYPYTPDSSMQWNNDHGAWQWSSQMYFPGLANYEGRPFDISMTYSNFLNMGNSSGPDLSKYYTTNPGRVVVMKDETFYNNADFTSKGAA
ncbi:GH25 family lysozyme, partial [Enterococcus faecalis]